jgi:large subunit ribosomal protein L35
LKPKNERGQNVFSLANRGRSSNLAAPMSKNPGICKTRKAVAKRFKITGTGKILRRHQGKRHLLQNKSRSRKNRLGKVALVHKRDMKAILQNMPFSH